MTREEREFWKAVYCAHMAGPHGWETPLAHAAWADAAVDELRKRQPPEPGYRDASEAG